MLFCSPWNNCDVGWARSCDESRARTGTQVLKLELRDHCWHSNTGNCVVMTDEIKFKLYVFRYSGNIVSGEFVTLAICLVEDSDHPDRFVGFEAMKNWSRLKGFFPKADVEFLKSWCRNLADEIRKAKRSVELFQTLENSSGSIDVSVELRAVLSHKQPEAEMKFLTNSYLR